MKKHGYLLIITLEPYPDPDILVRFAGVFDQTYTRFLDLKNAEAQARESQIEAALERVRSRSLAMHKTDELQDVMRVVAEELKNTGVILDTGGAVICTYFQDSKDVIHWTATDDPAHPSIPYMIPYFEDELFDEAWASKNRGDDYFAKEFSYDVKNAFFNHAFEHSDYRQLPEEYKKIILESKSHGLAWTWSENSAIMIPSLHGDLPSEEEKKILVRFAKVFEQSFIRFLDLKKSEEQAKEAKIQLALERVRAKTMAMKTQSDLLDIIELFGQQLNAVDIKFGNVTFIEGAITKTRDWDLWSHAPDAEIPTQKILIPYIEDPHFKKTAEAVEQFERTGQTVHVKSFTKSEKDSFVPHFVKHIPEHVTEDFIEILYDAPGEIIVDAFFEEITVSLVKWDDEPYSEGELAIFERFAKEFRQTYIRYLDIKKAEEQAREAKIEAALERVRARSMGMHKSDDLIDVVREIGKGIHELGIQLHYSQIYTDYTYDLKTGLNIWVDVEGRDYLEKFHLPYIDHSITLNYYNALNEGLDYFSDRFSKAGKDSYFKLLFKYSDLKRIPKKRKELILNASGWTRFTVILTEAALNFGRYSLDEFTDEDHEIFIRFAKVFGQAYTRFLDLKKAEEQAKEAQVEAALERVRSRSLAMHKTDELQNVVRVVAEELKNTGVILDTGGAVICTYFQDSKDVIHWTATDDQSHPSVPYLLPYFKDQLFDEAWESKSRGDDFFAKEFSYDVKNAFFNHAFEHSDYRQLPDAYKKIILESKSHGLAWAWAENSAIMIPSIQGDLPPEEEKKILIRFAKVFEQSFIRFLDLQKSEAQAREAQINLAVERVRARALAMFGSEEILDVVNTLKKEIMGLEIPDVTSASIHLREPDGRYRVWDLTSVEDGDKGLDISLDVSYRMEDTHPDFFMREIWANEENYFVVVQEGDRMDHTVDWLQKNGHEDYAKEFETFLRETSLERAYHPTVPLEKGRMSLDTLNEPTPEVKSVLKKMAGAFDLAYKRFEDLKKAEAQTREAQIEAALERARAQSMMMQHSDEISSISKAFHEQLILLDIPSEFSYVWLPDESDQTHQFWASWSEAKAGEKILQSKQITYPLDRSEPYTAACFAAWADPDVILEEFIPSRDIAGFFDVWEELLSGANKLNAEFFPEGIYYSEAYMRYGCFGINIRRKLTSEEKNILKRFSKEFERAYTRFLDLQKAENQALLIRKERDRLEIALNKLHATQDQLVQQEKLASLGQLTAGIAHEIKNPLNFVNNFSDLSLELVEEIREEVRRMTEGRGRGSEKENPPLLPRRDPDGKRESDPSADGEARGVSDEASNHDLILEILEDIETNLKTIHKHGSRADSIVKSMLEHSRGGTGKIEPTDLNALIKEYVNLSFHGMCAGKDPINVDIDLQLDENVGEIPLVAEDFSRVILNLTNNAFDAMREKLSAPSVSDSRASEKAKGKRQKSLRQPAEGAGVPDGTEVGDDTELGYHPKLTIRTHRDENTVTIEIEDNGPGIPEEMKDKILQPFFTTKKGTQGTGLGLSITNDIVKAHGGALNVSTKAGKGTTFTLELPK